MSDRARLDAGPVDCKEDHESKYTPSPLKMQPSELVGRTVVNFQRLEHNLKIAGAPRATGRRSSQSSKGF